MKKKLAVTFGKWASGRKEKGVEASTQHQWTKSDAAPGPGDLSRRSTPIRLIPSASSAGTLLGSSADREARGDVESIRDRSTNTTERLSDLRVEMGRMNIDY